MLIGAKYKLLRPMLGNPAGVIGYVFNEYRDFDRAEEFGIQIIFPNGEYDGFSAEEQWLYLSYEGFDLRYIGYIFWNVIQVSVDFRKGYWSWE